LTRFEIVDAGMTSAEDPKYTVEPQRARAREATADTVRDVAGQHR
jgi:hypothetical protein